MSDSAHEIAHNPAAPLAERYDAQAELAGIYRPVSSQLFPPEDMQKAIAYFTDGLLEGEMMQKASASKNLSVLGMNKNVGKRGMQSVYLDELQIWATGDYYDKPSPLGFDSLRAMVEQTPVLNAVVMTRLRQVSLFTQISEDGGRGFEIRHQDKKHKMSDEDLQATGMLAKFFANCGWEFNPRKRKMLKRDSFTQFMMKSCRDSLSMDAAPIETEFKRNRALGIDGFYAVDGATIRLCTDQGYEGDDKIFAVQAVNGILATTYTHDQLIYEVRNPRSDVRLAGYGMGETELLVRTVTGYLNAMTHNMRGFDENAIPKGILTLMGDYGSEDLAAFKRMWNATVKGINNAWTMPVMSAKDPQSKAEFTPFGEQFNEMFFAKWMTFLTSIVCAIYAIDPTEINFESFASGTSSLSGDDTKEKLANSKDKGFRPLMAYYESMLTDFIVSDFSDKYCFRWVGIDDEDAELVDKRKLASLSLNEYRGELGYEPYPDAAIGEAPMNASLMSAWQANKQMEAQAAMQQQPDYGEEDGSDDGAAPQNGTMPEGASGDAPPAPDGSETGGEAGGEFGQSEAAKSADFGKALTIFSFGE